MVHVDSVPSGSGAFRAAGLEVATPYAERSSCTGGFRRIQQGGEVERIHVIYHGVTVGPSSFIGLVHAGSEAEVQNVSYGPLHVATWRGIGEELPARLYQSGTVVYEVGDRLIALLAEAAQSRPCESYFGLKKVQVVVPCHNSYKSTKLQPRELVNITGFAAIWPREEALGMMSLFAPLPFLEPFIQDLASQFSFDGRNGFGDV